jgi:hypothetical protein
MEVVPTNTVMEEDKHANNTKNTNQGGGKDNLEDKANNLVPTKDHLDAAQTQVHNPVPTNATTDEGKETYTCEMTWSWLTLMNMLWMILSIQFLTLVVTM